ncbi:MAG: CBS domain-containing protein [Alphaproteobacteria bacterium]|nr:CBS domain-containing protein [Alphaproteobacteria bacterium]MBU0797731.1 CBS domain-containing protein [Alphaproteobacteria bacterium]MBU0887108.1 CBS domain-containing protein [Alphaproteobacteria bacterium]MBU1814358.1 CBS domain-containing protein [Alphaproteobacteria bacterium]
MLVSDILNAKGNDVVTAAPHTLISEAAKILAENRIGSVLVMNGAQLAGILSERDIVRVLAAEGAACLDGPVSRIMTAKVVTCRPDQTISDVMQMMTNGRFRHVPVMAEGKLAGMISIGDVVKWRLEEAQEEVRQMAAYVTGA